VKLNKDFFLQEDVVQAAKSLLGKKIFTRFEGEITGGIIVETEAYRGVDDRASHAFPMKRTLRTETMFMEGGQAYVYLCYGLHHLFNVVTGREGNPDAVLIRAIEPIYGLAEMQKRRGPKIKGIKISSGPACLTMALAIDSSINKTNLCNSDCIWLEEGLQVTESEIAETTRVGVGYAGEDANRLWRFYLKNNLWVSSKPKNLQSMG
jgi:DNA-3-methyladenine glycosylase